MITKEYADRVFEPIDWQMRKERTQNDYRENPVNEYEGFKSKEEEDAYYEKLDEMITDGINPIY